MEYKAGSRRDESTARIYSIKRVLWIILFLNLFVALAKYGYGSLSNTASIQADGIHSLFDSAGNIVGLIGMVMAGRPADYDHPYGHAKYESFASAAIGIMLLFAAYKIGSTAIMDLIQGTSAPEVSVISFAVMIITMIINISITFWEYKEARRLGSEMLAADARHTLSDVLVSLSVIVGLIFVRFGFVIADSLMSLVVAVAILFTSYEVFKQANTTLSDSARISKNEVSSCVLSVQGARGCHEIRTRGSNNEVYVDLHLLVDPLMNVLDAHELAGKVETHLINEFPQIADVVIHIEPDDERQRQITLLENASSMQQNSSEAENRS